MTAESTPDAPGEPEAERILLVDDNPINLQVLYETLNGLGFKLLIAKNGESALRIAHKLNPQLVLLDIMMPGIDGYEVCRRLKADPKTSEMAVIFLSALDDTKAKIRGLELGAVDFITKPFQNDEVIARVNTHLTIDRLKRELRARNAALEHELRVAEEHMRDARRRVEGPLLGESVAVRGLREAIAGFAATTETLLLGGPAGAGQEAVARAIHHESKRGGHAFIYVNCATLQGSSGAQLLGHGSGADGGAGIGKLELAESGTLYLDGVHLIPSEFQDRLVGVLSERETRKASDGALRPDVRVIAYTPQDLSRAAQTTSFNLRLVEQLARSQLTVPALAERRDDITGLAWHYAEQQARRIGTALESISDESMERLKAYRWPGNILELQSVIERAVVNATGPVIEIEEGQLEEGLPLGHYRLLEKLGVGGMGEVWRAKHQLLARPAAVKLIRDDAVAGEKRQPAVDRFRREASAIANLNSPNTIKLFDFGVSETGSFYYVMELLEGMDISDMVKRHGVLPPARVAMLLGQACRSLAEAHEAGLLHRDIKPANLFVCKLGPEYDFVKVLDFGIVKPVGEDAAAEADLTQGAGILGTPNYLAPELILHSETLDGRADIYSLGCVAYYMLAGRTVFTGDAMSVVAQQVKNDPEPLPNEVPTHLASVVMDCLNKEPQDRPASAMQLWQRLIAIEFDEPWTQDMAEQWWKQHASAAGGEPSKPDKPDLPTLLPNT